MEHIITLFHGSEKVVEVPIFGVDKKTNDFGPGFYCTESERLAKEWGCFFSAGWILHPMLLQ